MIVSMFLDFRLKRGLTSIGRVNSLNGSYRNAVFLVFILGTTP